MLTKKVEWKTPGEVTDQIAEFMTREIGQSPVYISHTEYFGGRSPDGRRFAENLFSKIREELAVAARGETPPVGIAMASDGGEILGIAIVSWGDNGQERYAVVEDLVVAAASRGCGVGTRLMDEIKAEARKRGCMKIFLETGGGNDSAHRFFESGGFLPFSKIYVLPL